MGDNVFRWARMRWTMLGDVGYIEVFEVRGRRTMVS